MFLHDDALIDRLTKLIETKKNTTEFEGLLRRALEGSEALDIKDLLNLHELFLYAKEPNRDLFFKILKDITQELVEENRCPKLVGLMLCYDIQGARQFVEDGFYDKLPGLFKRFVFIMAVKLDKGLASRLEALDTKQEQQTATVQSSQSATATTAATVHSAIQPASQIPGSGGIMHFSSLPSSASGSRVVDQPGSKP